MTRQSRRDEAPHTRDALWSPQRDGRRRGPTRRITRTTSAYTRAALSDVGRALPMIAAGAVVAAAVRRMREAS